MLTNAAPPLASPVEWTPVLLLNTNQALGLQIKTFTPTGIVNVLMAIMAY